MATATAPPASSYTVHVHGNIVAIKSPTEFEIQGGTGVGYLNVYTTSTTVKYYNGLTPKAGAYADIYGTGSTATYVTAKQVSLSSSSTSTSGTPAAGSYTVHVHGDIVAIKSSTEFEIQGGTGVGYLNVYTTSSTVKNYNGLTLKAGEYADIYGTGSTSTYVTARQVSLSSSSTSTGGTPAASSYTVHVHGGIVAIKSSTEFEIQGGTGVGYLNVYTTSSTVKNYNGLTLKAGDYADVYGTGSTSTYVTATQVTLSTSSTGTTSTPPPTTTVTSGVPKHVLTAGLIYGYSGTPTTVPLSSIAPWLTWAETDPKYAAELRAAGIKVAAYMNFWRNYGSDNPLVGYNDLKPGGAHADAEAKTCTGSVIYDSTYGGGYIANAMSPTYASEHAKVLAQYRETEFAGNYDALFSDDTGTVYGISTPCGYTASAWMSGTNAVHASLGKAMFVNALNGSSQTAQVGYTGASNVIGAMCESCYAYWVTVSGVRKDFPRSNGTWVDTENAEAQMAARHKIFWEYARAIGSAASETALRNYVDASFLLTYDPNYAMLQEVWSTPSKFEIFPEAGLVPMNPVTTSTSVSSYQRSGGAYMREFGACYYRGVNKGRCAVVVNPSSSSSVTVPTTAYSHAMVLSGYGVLDGGTVSFAGSRPSSLGPTSGVVLFP